MKHTNNIKLSVSMLLLVCMVLTMIACARTGTGDGISTSSYEIISPVTPDGTTSSAPNNGTSSAESTTNAETTPVVTTPSATTPEATTPAITTPVVTTPAVTTPAVTTPAVTTPAVTTPAVTTPAVTTPAVTTPAVTTPAVTTPAVTTPAVTTPGTTTEKEPDPEPVGGRVIYYQDFESIPLTNDSATAIAKLSWLKDSTSNGAYNNNTTLYSIRNNRGSNMLYLENNFSSATDSYLFILSTPQMGIYHESNYTYQYDIIYTNASASDRYIALVSDYDGRFYNSFHFRNKGTANNQCHYDGTWYTYDVSGQNYAPNTNDYSIVKKLLGKSYNASSQAFSNISISIRYVVDWENGNSVYMRVNDEGYPGSGIWTLVSKGASADSDKYFDPSTGGAALVLKTGGRQNGYIDNIIVWEGTGDEPEDKSSPLLTCLTHTCSQHVWEGDGSCVDPFVCKYCGEQKSGSDNHKYTSVSGSGDKICTVCDGYKSAIDAKQPLTAVPLYDGGNKTQRLYESGHGMTESTFSEEYEAYMQIISQTSENEYKAYLSKLEKYGYKQTYTYSLDGNLYAQYLRGEQRIYVYYTAKVGEVRIIEDFHSNLSPSEFGYTYNKKEGDTTVLYQYGVPMNEAGVNISKNDEKKIDCGMMYVMKLADNSVFIIDGGGYQQFDEAQKDGFMQFLYDVTGTEKGGKIRIAGWYISHGHSDHMAGFCLFVKKYHENLTLERIFHNFPSANSPTSILSTAGTSNHRKMMDYVNTYFADDEPQYIKIHTGQVIQLADVKISVMFTHEDIVDPIYGKSEVANDYNNSCSVLYIEFDGMKFAMLGDVNRPAMSIIIANNSKETLKADVVQLAHHVINNLSELYNIIQAPVVLVPQSPNGAVNGSARKSSMNAAKKYLKDDMLYYASLETTGISVVDGKLTKTFTAPVHGDKYTGWKW